MASPIDLKRMLRRHFARTHSLFAWTLLVVASPASAGVLFEFELEDHRGSLMTSRTALVSVEGDDLLMNISSADGPAGDVMVIFCGAKSEMSVVSHRSKSYVVFDQDVLDSFASEIDSKIEEALENVPEAQRTAAEKDMRERMRESSRADKEAAEATYEYRASGDHETINGYPAERYDVYDGDLKLRELWVSEWKDVDGKCRDPRRVRDDGRVSNQDQAHHGPTEQVSDRAPHSNQ